MREVEIIPDTCEELGCYRWVYISLHFINEDEVDKRKNKVCMYLDHDD